MNVFVEETEQRLARTLHNFVDAKQSDLFKQFPLWCEQMIMECGDVVDYTHPVRLTDKHWMVIAFVGPWDEDDLHHHMVLAVLERLNNEQLLFNKDVEPILVASIKTPYWMAKTLDERHTFVENVLREKKALASKRAIIDHIKNNQEQNLNMQNQPAKKM